MEEINQCYFGNIPIVDDVDMYHDNNIDLDQLDSFRVQTLYSYIFLRTMSCIIHISPFDVEYYIACLNYEGENRPQLLNDIHIKLLSICIRKFPSHILSSWCEVPWSLVDDYTWPEFLSPCLLLFQNHFHDKNCQTKAKDLLYQFTEQKHFGVCYNQFPRILKLHIIELLIEFLLSQPETEINMERRNNSQFHISDPFPLLKKGRDGYPDICVICLGGGDLICCEYCPGAYHKDCLDLKDPKVTDSDYWQCPECKIPDIIRGKAKVEWISYSRGFVTAIGNILVHKPHVNSSFSDYREISLKQFSEIISELNKSLFYNIPFGFFIYYFNSLLLIGAYELGDIVDDDYDDTFDSDDEESVVYDSESCDDSLSEFYDESRVCSIEEFSDIKSDITQKDLRDDSQSDHMISRRSSRLSTTNLKISLLDIQANKNKVVHDNDIETKDAVDTRKSKRLSSSKVNSITDTIEDMNQEIKKRSSARVSSNFSKSVLEKLDTKPVIPKRRGRKLFDYLCKLKSSIHGRVLRISDITKLFRKEDFDWLSYGNQHYQNIYRKIKVPILFDSIENYLIPTNLSQKSFLASIESILHVIGPICNFSIRKSSFQYFIDYPFDRNYYLVNLYNNQTLHFAKKLLLLLLDSIDCHAMCPKWYLSITELSSLGLGDLGNLEYAQVGITEETSYKVINRKLKILRIPRYFSFQKAFQSKRSEFISPIQANISTSPLRKPISPEKTSELLVIKTSDNRELETNDDKDEIIHIERRRGYENIEWSSGRKLLKQFERCDIPKKLLKKLGRNAGLGLLPSFAYILEANYFASPPYALCWKHRVRHCKSFEELILLLRILEQGFNEEVRQKFTNTSNDMSMSTLVELTNNEYISKFKVSSIEGDSIVKSSCILENMYCMATTASPSTKFNSDTLYCRYSSVILAHLESKFNEYSKVLNRQLDYSLTQIHSNENSKENVNRYCSMLASYNYRVWALKLLSKADNNLSNQEQIAPELVCVYQFIRDLYAILQQVVLPDDTGITVYKEAKVAIKALLDTSKVTLTNLYIEANERHRSKVKRKQHTNDHDISRNSLDKSYQSQIIERLVSSFLNNILIGLSDLTRYDVITSSDSNKNAQSFRKSPRISNTTTNNITDGLSQSVSYDTINTNMTNSSSNIDLSLGGPLLYLNKSFDLRNIFRFTKKSSEDLSSPIAANLVKQRYITSREASLVDRKDCSALILNELHYSPQVGDEVLYFIEGHREYIKEYPDLYHIERRGVYKKKQLMNENAILCRILTIDFEFPLAPSTKMNKVGAVIQLGIVGSLGYNPAKKFTIYYIPGHSSAEFLILRELIERSCYLEWKQGMSFSMRYEGNERYEGVVQSSVKDDNGIPKWAGCVVLWNSWGYEDKVNEWELDPISVLPKKGKNKKESSTDSSKSLNEFNRLINDRNMNKVACNKKLGGICERIKAMKEFEAFSPKIEGLFKLFIFLYDVYRLILKRF